MKIQFDTPLKDTTGAALSAANLAALSYTILLDTVNPPVKSYPVPASVIQAATPNSDGSLHVTIDAEKDLGVTLSPSTAYFVAAEDSLGNQSSPETAVIEFDQPAAPVTPAQPSNFSVG